jgi:fatty-acyl-CoA synthase
MSEVEHAWVWNRTIGDALRETSQQHPTRDALVLPRWCDHETVSDTADGFHVSYAQYDRLVDEAAKSLLALGVQRGDHIGVWATNWPRWAIMQFAAARVGAVFVTINPAYRTDEVSYVIKQSEITTLFVVREFRTSNYVGMLQELIPELVGAGSGPFRTANFPKLSRIVSLHSGAHLAEREATLSPTDAINIQYTSGTTGFPKGATLTHRNILINAFLVGQGMTLTSADRMCVPVPFYHCFGCVYGTLIAGIFGAALVIPAEYFDPVATVQAIKRAYYVHRHDANGRIRSGRHAVAANRHCCWQPLPDRLDETHCDRDGRRRDYDRVWADRKLPRHHADTSYG